MDIENTSLPKIRGREKEQKVMSKKSNLIVRNESGVALVVALFMIVLLSLIGLASSSSSTFEIKLSGNKRGATDAFYSADSGLQAVMGDTNNFTCSDTNTTGVPPEIISEGFGGKKTSNFTFNLPAGYAFADQPTMKIYRTTQKKVPRGLGMSAINFLYEYYIADSTGRDQTDFSSVKSQSEIREKIVRLEPTGQ